MLILPSLNAILKILTAKHSAPLIAALRHGPEPAIREILQRVGGSRSSFRTPWRAAEILNFRPGTFDGPLTRALQLLVAHNSNFCYGRLCRLPDYVEFPEHGLAKPVPSLCLWALQAVGAILRLT
jgi:hypothetical protein